MSKVRELFGKNTSDEHVDWPKVVAAAQCPFTGRRCYKTRKSDPTLAIGTCTVGAGRNETPVVICPSRMTERRQMFADCLHLLTNHEPGNELHIVSEVSVPGGSVDFFLVSARRGKVRDFVGIEIQTLDTTGSVWPERQRLLVEKGLLKRNTQIGEEGFGINWKMTAKTILVQMHHKSLTFEHVNKKLVLVIQDGLLEYMKREFNFAHLNDPAQLGDAIHFHAYTLNEQKDGSLRMGLGSRLSTDVAGIAACLGLQAEARVELEQLLETLESKISEATLFAPV